MNYIYYMNVPIKNGMVGGIRTPDPLVPNQMRYQTALLPYEITAILLQDSNLCLRPPRSVP